MRFTQETGFSEELSEVEPEPCQIDRLTRVIEAACRTASPPTIACSWQPGPNVGGQIPTVKIGPAALAQLESSRASKACQKMNSSDGA